MIEMLFNPFKSSLRKGGKSTTLPLSLGWVIISISWLCCAYLTFSNNASFMPSSPKRFKSKSLPCPGDHVGLLHTTQAC